MADGDVVCVGAQFCSGRPRYVRSVFSWLVRGSCLCADRELHGVACVAHGNDCSLFAPRKHRRPAAPRARQYLMSVEAATSAMAHEIRRPLAGIAVRGAAALNLLKRMPPDLDQVTSAVASIVASSHRAGEIISSIRGLFKRTDSERAIVH